MSELENWLGAKEVDISDIIPDPSNPNVMSDKHFDQLVEMITEEGFDEPIQIAEHPDEDGKFIIIGGEHRWRAAKSLGMEKIPAVLKDSSDEVTRKTQMVRRNLVRGELDRVRFSQLIKDIEAKHHISPDELSGPMGFASEEELGKSLVKERQERDEKVEELLDGTKKEVTVIDNVSYVLSEIFSRYGETVPQGFIFFCHKNRMHLLVQCEEDLYRLVQEMSTRLGRDNEAINTFLSNALSSEMAGSGMSDTGDAVVEYVPEEQDVLKDAGLD